MSIFRNTFTPEVQNQIKARQETAQRKKPEDIIYLNSRNSWVRMTSGVNVKDKDTLARQYILQGGTLNNKKLREGIGDQSKAYSNTSPSGNPYNTGGTAGLKPMPGITSVDVKSKTAYGSLREVTVHFSCNNIQQLEDLELLYMRPGYTVLVEWGWAPFIQTDPKGKLPPKLQYNIEFYDGVLDGKASNGKNDREQIFLDLFEKSKYYSGNYDAHYGYVKNYNWTARMDGGYDCTTTLISVSEILESLRADWVALDTGNIVNNKGLIGHTYDSPATYTAPTTENINQALINAASGGFARDLLAQAYSKGILTGLCYELKKTCIDKYKSNSSQPIAFTIPSLNKKSTYDLYVQKINLDQSLTPSPTTPLSNIQPYITLESFISLVNERIILHYADKNGDNRFPFLQISTKSNIYESPQSSLLCLAHPLQVSIDPSVCIITNPIWASGINVNGNSVKIDYLNDLKAKGGKEFRYQDDWSNELGVIDNIYLNINKLQALAENMAGGGKELKIYDYITKVLKEVQESIGGVNSFEIHVDPIDNHPRIIDLNYVDSVDSKTAGSAAFQIEMSNTSGTVRSYNLQSLIFPNQANLIALGSQIGGGGNQASQNNTMLDFNDGLEDRIMPKKVAAPTSINVNISNSNISNVLTNNFNALSQLFNVYNSKADPIQDKTPPPHQPTYNYKTALKDIIAYFQGITYSKTKNKAIIPVKMSLTMDGIGGLIIGHLFKIPQQLLPKGYKISASEYKLVQVVTGIDHKIENGDWTTTIDSQQIITGEPKGILKFTDIVKIDLKSNQASISIASDKTPSGLPYPIDGVYTIKSPALSARVNPISGKSEIHPGIDLGVPAGTPVFAVEDGTVVAATYQDKGAGNYVKIAHTSTLANYTTLYMHLKEYYVKKGDVVTRGQQIGISGNTGASTGPHLHFEMRKTGTEEAINPNQFFPKF
jgi:hypothetical protein